MAQLGRQLRQELGFRRGFRGVVRYALLSLQSHEDARVSGAAQSLVWAHQSGRLSFHSGQCLCQLSAGQFVDFVAWVAERASCQAEEVRLFAQFFAGREHDGQLRLVRDYLGL